MVLAVAAGVFAVEVAGGIFSGSLALLSDAGHVFVDKVALVVSIVVAHLVKKRRHREGEIRAWGGAVNAALLALISLGIFWMAAKRVSAPPEILGGWMLAAALVGIGGNYLQLRFMATGDDHHLTHESVRLHILSDLWQSVAVIAAALVITLTDFTLVDPVLSAIIAGAMGYWSVRLFVKSGRGGHNH